ncbi:MAG TPA: HAD family phosphatase [Patescibacteria group bacterium]|jgi:putative hydrolase of the HAD superfamily|nr:HAD family phosphatase [Patescibacteria group bacterium]
MITTILFDFFDVIRDDGLARWLRKNGLTKTGDVLAITDANDRGELTPAELFRRLGELTGETADAVEYELEHNNNLNQPLVEYIRDQLRGTYKVGLVSNSKSDYIRNEIRTYELESLFDAFIISSEVGAIKPQPEIFHIALEQLHSQPTETIFIDDNPIYVDAANQLGIHGIVYTDFLELKHALETQLVRVTSEGGAR